MFKGSGKIVWDNKSSSYPVFELTGVNCICRPFKDSNDKLDILREILIIYSINYKKFVFFSVLAILLLAYTFYKQPVYKQLALGSQIAKQLSWLNPLSLITIKTTDYRKEFFLCNKCKVAVKPAMHQNSAVSKALLGKLLIINIIIFESWKLLDSSQT